MHTEGFEKWAGQICGGGGEGDGVKRKYGIERILKLERFLYNRGGKAGDKIAHFIKIISRVIYACDISYKAEISESCSFPHQGLGVVIGDKAKIGKNCIIRQNVTIGAKGCNSCENPEIGDGCMIGAGAIILGGIKIGSNVQIGANAVVVDDVPDNVIVGGIPAKIIKCVGR